MYNVIYTDCIYLWHRDWEWKRHTHWINLCALMQWLLASTPVSISIWLCSLASLTRNGECKFYRRSWTIHRNTEHGGRIEREREVAREQYRGKVNEKRYNESRSWMNIYIYRNNRSLTTISTFVCLMAFRMCAFGYGCVSVSVSICTVMKRSVSLIPINMHDYFRIM